MTISIHDVTNKILCDSNYIVDVVKFWGLIAMSVELTGGKLVGGLFALFPHTE